MVRLMRHRQTKGPATDRPHLTHRATSRLYKSPVLGLHHPDLFTEHNTYVTFDSLTPGSLLRSIASEVRCTLLRGQAPKRFERR
jgi:hypothetical protein